MATAISLEALSPSEPEPLAFRRRFGRKLVLNILDDAGVAGIGTPEALAAFGDCFAALDGHPDLTLRRNGGGPADLAHFMGWGPAFLYGPTRKASRRILTIPRPPASSAAGALARSAAEAWLLAAATRADAIVTPTPGAARRIAGLEPAAPVWTIPMAVPDGFTPSPGLRRRGRALLGIEEGRPIVLGAGGLSPEDRIDDFAAVARARPSALFLWIGLAGGGPEDGPAIDAFAGGGPPNLRFAGGFSESELPAVFNAADAFLHPAPRMDAPGIPLRAAACGLPLAVRELPGRPLPWDAELLGGADVPALARAIGRLLDSEPERARWAALSRRLAEPHRIAAVAKRLVALYDLAACGELARPPRTNKRTRRFAGG